MFGFLNIYKSKGMTSHDVVSVLRRITKIRQIGHTGTLDPFAEGVLPICIGKATRLIEYLADDKTYIATVRFGQNTDTYDIEGKITEKFNKKVTETEIATILKQFKGKIEQIPPIYSAIKVNGKKLYEYAREGKKVEIKPRGVNIYQIELKSFDKINQIAEIYVKCSKGTYIRSLGYDIGKKLGCGAYLSKLIRVQVGCFGINESIKIENLTLKTVNDNLIYPLEKLLQEKIEISKNDAEKISHGIEINSKNDTENKTVVLTHDKKLVAVAKITNNKIKAKKVFYEN